MSEARRSQRAIVEERLAKFMESETSERVAERKRRGARYGHIKRKLKEGTRLEGNLLALAVEAVGRHSELADKLRAGQKLDDYETHLMIDMYLLHARLSA